MKKCLLCAASPTMVAAAPAMADVGDWLVCGRVIYVAPNERAAITPIGGYVSIDTSIVPDLDITYFVADQ